MVKIEDIESLEKIANENSQIAKEEILKAEDMLNLAKLEIKRATARKILVENEFELAKLREEIAERSKKLVEKKEKVKALLKFSKEALIHELDQANYNEQIAEIQKEVAEVQKKIANKETNIAEVKKKFITKKKNEAEERKNLAKKQLLYVKLVKNSDSNEKIANAQKTYLKQQEILSKMETEVNQINRKIGEKQIELANLKKQLSAKLAEREKIRPIISNS